MLNQKLNLHLTLNKSLTNLQDPGPFTPLDQTLKTPIEPNQPNYAYNSFNFQNVNTPSFHNLNSNGNGNGNGNGSVYLNSNYNESDDILTDIDEPNLPFNSKTTKNYSLNFTPHFDQLVLSIYNYILSLPTTTPFSGNIPPSGLVSKVANETMDNLINETVHNNFQNYDQQRVINYDFLKNGSYQPIFLQLIRKRLIELCSTKSNNKLPLSTSISITTSGNANNSFSNASNSNGPYSGNVRQSSISNLSLTDININNYQNRSRSSSNSVNLRKQSLTRNNSYNNNWLHVGNLNTIKQSNNNESTDSLQSLQDFVPQNFIQRSANTPTQPGFNHMMMDYQTPPTSNKSSFSTPPNSNPNNQNQNQNSFNLMNVTLVQNATAMEFDDFNFTNPRSRSSSNSRNFPKPLTINTDNANLQALHNLQGLESPFMSATTPSEDFILFNSNQSFQIDDEKTIKVDRTLNEKKRESLKLKRGIH